MSLKADYLSHSELGALKKIQNLYDPNEETESQRYDWLKVTQ